MPDDRYKPDARDGCVFLSALIVLGMGLFGVATGKLITTTRRQGLILKSGVWAYVGSIGFLLLFLAFCVGWHAESKQRRTTAGFIGFVGVVCVLLGLFFSHR